MLTVPEFSFPCRAQDERLAAENKVFDLDADLEELKTRNPQAVRKSSLIVVVVWGVFAKPSLANASLKAGLDASALINKAKLHSLT